MHIFPPLWAAFHSRKWLGSYYLYIVFHCLGRFFCNLPHTLKDCKITFCPLSNWLNARNREWKKSCVQEALCWLLFSLNSDNNLFWPRCCLKAFEDYWLENKRKAATGKKKSHAACFKLMEHPRELVLEKLSLKAAAGMGRISVHLPISSWAYMIDVLIIS